MATLSIVQTPSPILKTPVKEIASIDKRILKIIKDMKETLDAQYDPQGVGLAAPQVGLNIALFIMKPTLKGKTEAFINPKILKLEHKDAASSTYEVQRGATGQAKNKQKTDNSSKLEGCLSIKRIWGPVKREDRVLLEYQTIHNEKKTEWFSGFKATIVQHEMDHLQGILFTQRVLEQKGCLYRETKDGDLEETEL